MKRKEKERNRQDGKTTGRKASAHSQKYKWSKKISLGVGEAHVAR
jgi:hypothetical protein